MLNIKNLEAKVDNKHILNGLNLDIKLGEVHAIMGPNGLPANDGSEYDRKIGSVCKEDLARFAERYFKESSRVELVVGAIK